MSHFAKIDKDIVVQVIVAELKDIQSGIFGKPSDWVQTSYNTWHGQHPENKPLRKNFAGIGYTYDKNRDAFIPPKPYPSWKLNEQTCDWEPPSPTPQTEIPHIWDEDLKQWVSINDIQ